MKKTVGTNDVSFDCDVFITMLADSATRLNGSHKIIAKTQRQAHETDQAGRGGFGRGRGREGRGGRGRGCRAGPAKGKFAGIYLGHDKLTSAEKTALHEKRQARKAATP
jgi:hypothetical protein